MSNSSEIKLSKIWKALKTTKEGRITILWIVLMIAVFIWSSLMDDYWETWSFSSVFMVLIYGFSIILINLRDIYKHLKSNSSTLSALFQSNAKNILFLLSFLIILIALIAILGIAIIDHLSNPITDFRNLPFSNKVLFTAYKFSPLLIVFSFLGFDWFYYKMLLNLDEVNESDKNEIITTIKLVDLPSVVSIFTINLFYIAMVIKNGFPIFSLEGNERNYLEIFMAGSGAFSLISFNIIFATISMFNSLKTQKNGINIPNETD